MRFTQSQVREIVGLTEEKMRVWRKALPPLLGRTGHAPVFTLADMLALSVILDLTDGYGAKVGHLTRVAPQLFAICEQAVNMGRFTSCIVLTPQEARLLQPDDLRFAAAKPHFVAHVGAVVDRLRSALAIIPDQIPLPLPGDTG